MAVHEATHGVVLQTLTTVKHSYAVRFPFLTTGNHAYLTRRSAIVVALAPAVIWGILLVAALLALPQDYLLTAYILLALNFAGSARGLRRGVRGVSATARRAGPGRRGQGPRLRASRFAIGATRFTALARSHSARNGFPKRQARLPGGRLWRSPPQSDQRDPHGDEPCP
ncbi:DUF3267 domain-containing protein [Glaciibacter superstes]|uniref:DUF3267 domain-containing protein n=1 Tax=Glaciibacter superstes TaxID=501023 RepID=UPI001B7FC554